MNNYVLIGNDYGYEKFNNFSTLIYVVLCHYLNRWLLALSQKVMHTYNKQQLHWMIVGYVILHVWCYLSE
jgi:hypothetical protein